MPTARRRLSHTSLPLAKGGSIDFPPRRTGVFGNLRRIRQKPLLPMRSVLSRLEFFKLSLLIFFFLLGILYHSTIRVRFWWYRRSGRDAEVEATVNRMVQEWAERVISRIGCRVEIEGRENIPATGPVVIMTNHQSMYDILILLCKIREATGFVTKRELFRLPGFSFWMRQIHCVSLDRSDPRSALALYDQLGRWMEERGAGFVIFPEGTRTRDPDGAMGPFREGSLRLATARGLPILPISIDGTRFLSMREPIYDTRHGGRLVRIKIAPLVQAKARSGRERRALMTKIHEIIRTNLETIKVRWPAPPAGETSGAGQPAGADGPAG